ncbi:tyrosine-protein phosphatase [Ethanoligenens harbinense]|uniref:tyrosine-protein phosphatase n=1 Tax=Ethanoligenens harbinense TaxID=253239 RepID=UPI000EA379F3|nr:tyrosine-protein phosphatase [Ethanoligenens harbinense]AYF41778.1 hypothetical protein CN246_09150 [Ethanoligenens harbinense]
MQEISRPFKLDGAKNVRELGGYRVLGGGMTQPRRFLRGDELQNLTEADCRALYEYGVRQIIDLRSQDEVLRGPDRLPQCCPDVAWMNVPMSDHVRGNRYSSEFPPSMWQLYEWLLDDGGDGFRLIFKTILQAAGGCVLIHCIGGKDRTGVVSMLLLKLAGVNDDIVARDYAVTEQAMKDIFPVQQAEMESRGLVVPAYVLQSPPENMFKTLTYLRDTYGSAAGYLSYIGLSDAEIAALRERLLSAFREQA